jgi:hypothetical protein
MKTLLSILPIMILAWPTYCGAGVTTKACREDAAHQYCWLLYVADKTAAVYVEPDPTSEIVELLPIGRSIRANWRKSSGKENWIFYREDGSGKSGWINEKNLVGNLDFRRVVGCWPLRRINDDDPRVGDFSFSADFKQDGSVESEELSGKPRVWIAGNLILIGSHPDNNSLMYIFRPKAKKIIHPGQDYELTELEWFSDAEMAPCRGRTPKSQ